jgi:hypothetical protein
MKGAASGWRKLASAEWLEEYDNAVAERPRSASKRVERPRSASTGVTPRQRQAVTPRGAGTQAGVVATSLPRRTSSRPEARRTVPESCNSEMDFDLTGFAWRVLPAAVIAEDVPAPEKKRPSSSRRATLEQKQAKMSLTMKPETAPIPSIPHTPKTPKSPRTPGSARPSSRLMTREQGNIWEYRVENVQVAAIRAISGH